MNSEETTADRRKREAEQGPIILYGHPTKADIQEAAARAKGRGVLVLADDATRLLADDGQEIDMDQPAPDLDPEQHFGNEWEQPVIKATVDVPAVATDREPEDPYANDLRYPLSDETTMAEEPIELRLRRAFLNGFKEGVDRASNTIEGWGRWDA